MRYADFRLLLTCVVTLLIWGCGEKNTDSGESALPKDSSSVLSSERSNGSSLQPAIVEPQDVKALTAVNNGRGISHAYKFKGVSEPLTMVH